MKKYRISWLFALVATLVIGLASCTKDTIENDFIELGQSNVVINKKGLSDKGQKMSFMVNSNVYWLINMPEDVDWLKISPRAGFGKTEVLIEALPNYETERSVTLVLETKDGINQQIIITQNGQGDLVSYIADNFDGSETEVDVEIELFTRWNKEGVTSLKTEYNGVKSYVSSDNPSTGYTGASGANNILFKEGQASFSVAKVETMGDESFELSFGYAAPATPASAMVALGARSRAEGGMTTADNEPLKLYVSKEAGRWLPIAYSIEASSNAWKQAKAVFKVPIDATILEFKFVSEAAGVRIDDFKFVEGSGEGEFLDFSKADVESTIVLKEDFEWVKYGSPVFWTTTGATRYDSWTADEQAKGWTTSMVDVAGGKQEPLLYGRPGFVSIGKTSYGGDLITPALSKIGEGMICDLEVTLDVVGYMTEKGVQDDNLLMINIIGDGIPSVSQMTIDNYATWEGSTRTFTVYGATAETKIQFKGGEQQLADIGVGKNRLFFDNIKIVAKDFQGIAPTQGFPFVWNVTAENKANPAMVNVKERWAMSESGQGKMQVMIAKPYSTADMSYTVGHATDGSYMLMYGFGLGDSWHFTLPVKGLRSGKVNMKATVASSAAGPKFYTVEYSLDNTEWFAVDVVTKIEKLSDKATVSPKEKEITYTYGMADSPANTQYNLNVNIPVSRYIADGNLYVRLRVSGDMSGDRSKWIVPGNGGTTRMVTASPSASKALSFSLVE